MPIYEYVCPSCDHEFEQLVRSVRDGEPSVCPACGHKPVERRLSVFAARQGTGGSPDLPIGGPCGRCGDPNGPCGM